MNRRRTIHGVPAGLAAMALALGACSAGPTAGDASPADARPTTHPAPAATPDEVPSVPETDDTLLPAGRYSLRVTPTLTYEVDVPGPRYVDEGRYLHHPDAPGVFVITRAPADGTLLPNHPCTDKTGRAVGRTPEDLVRGLAGQDVITVGRPRPVTLDGARGVTLEVRVPADFDTTRCQDAGDTTDDVELFHTKDGDRWSWGAGYLARWWILDVHGERIVVMNHCDVTCPPRDRAVLRRMAESVTFTPGG